MRVTVDVYFLANLQLIDTEGKTMIMGQRAPQIEDGNVPFLGIGKQAHVREVVRGGAFIVRARGKISSDDLFSFDLISPRGHSYMIIGCDETTRGVQAKARPEVSFCVELRAKLPRDTKFYRGSRFHRGNRYDDLAKILSVFHCGRRRNCRGTREDFLGRRDW